MIYVSSDWHGCDTKKIKALLKKAGFDNGDYLFVLGDVIDRGGNSVELLKFLMNAHNIELILGNHEAFLLANDWLFEEITDKNFSNVNPYRLSLYDEWMLNGGTPTLEALRKETPETRNAIIEFLRECPLYDAVSAGGKDFLLVHGGLGNYRHDKRMEEYLPYELLEERPTLSTHYSRSFTTVIGHTPTYYYGKDRKNKILKMSTWIDIDTGAASGLNPCLLRLDDMEEFYI